MTMKLAVGGLIVAWLLAAPAGFAQVIVHPDYRPPETVQRVVIPVDPTEKRLKVLIISGWNSYEHDWTGVDEAIRRIFQDSKRFDVRVIEDFDHGNLATLKDFKVVLLNYSSRWVYSDTNEHRWSPEAEKALFDYVHGGGGLVVYHASFTFGFNWPEYHRLVGGVMDPRTSRRSPPGAFPLHIIDHDDPITRDMRDYIWTYNDDMYSNMCFDRQTKIHVLATTHDSSASYKPELAGPKYPASAYTPEKLKAMKGMDKDQPAIWTVNYGDGRVFAFTIGHDEISLGFPAIDALLLRGTEWAATGDVTIPLPSDAKTFPLN